jgi:hypothetical protein
MTFENLQKELVNSIKNKNRVKKNVIADMVTCAKNMAIEKGCKDNITEDIVDAAILKSKKICQEQIDTCPANRPDILEGYKVCMGYIDELAPRMMTEDEVRAAVQDMLNDNAENNKAALMKIIMPALKNKADGKLINKIVTDFIESRKDK